MVEPVVILLLFTHHRPDQVGQVVFGERLAVFIVVAIARGGSHLRQNVIDLKALGHPDGQAVVPQIVVQSQQKGGFVGHGVIATLSSLRGL
ncbi:MAG: hypothetical protein HUU55_20305 [Myxococcales bacterium]|nr:hypothetical protein [Myxococcales bacterium]